MSFLTPSRVFAFVHIRAFSYRPYVTDSDNMVSGPRGFRALVHAFDFRETFRELVAGTLYLFHRAHGREPEADKVARRAAILEATLGVERTWHHDPPRDREAEKNHLRVRVDVDIEEVNECGNEREERHRPFLRDPRRQKSEGLGENIERELQRKGYTMRGAPIVTHT
jgi:hypothetical protein